MSYKEEFPKWNGEWVCPKGYKDESYKNDELPHVKKIYEKDNTRVEYRIWEDNIPTEENNYYSVLEKEGYKYRFEIVVNSTIIYIEDIKDKKKLEEVIRRTTDMEYEGYKIM